MFSSKLSAVVTLAAIFFLMKPAHAAPQVLQHHVPQAIHESRRLGPVPAENHMALAVGLPLRNEGELDTFLAQLSDPRSPNYQHYLSATEFAERFGPTEEDYGKLSAFFQANGFEISATHTNRLILDVAGPVSAVERTFHVQMAIWEHPTRGEFFAPEADPWIDSGVAILDVTGLDNFVLPRPMDLKASALDSSAPLSSATGSGPAGLYIGKDFRAAYAPSVTQTGAAQTVGLFELDGFYTADVAANFAQAGLTPVSVQTVLLDGFNGSPGSGNIEVTLDIMMAAYMAPGAKVIVYEGTNWNDVLNRMATDNLAKQLSSSWCFSPINSTTENIFKQMIAQGQSLLQASGDSGAYSGPIYPPSDDPNVTVVGGTALTTSGPAGSWVSETTWSGSGGGVSTTYAIPSYQQGVNMKALGGSTTMRNIPDVALTAAIQMFLIANNGSGYMIGGTSAAAPLWAGFIALANQQAVANGKSPAGFLESNPLRTGCRLQLLVDAARHYYGQQRIRERGRIRSGHRMGHAGRPATDQLSDVDLGGSDVLAFGHAHQRDSFGRFEHDRDHSGHTAEWFLGHCRAKRSGIAERRYSNIRRDQLEWCEHFDTHGRLHSDCRKRQHHGNWKIRIAERNRGHRLIGDTRIGIFSGGVSRERQRRPRSKRRNDDHGDAGQKLHRQSRTRGVGAAHRGDCFVQFSLYFDHQHSYIHRRGDRRGCYVHGDGDRDRDRQLARLRHRHPDRKGRTRVHAVSGSNKPDHCTGSVRNQRRDGDADQWFQ